LLVEDGGGSKSEGPKFDLFEGTHRSEEALLVKEEVIPPAAVTPQKAPQKTVEGKVIRYNEKTDEYDRYFIVLH
jgi:hypothetical protein